VVLKEDPTLIHFHDPELPPMGISLSKKGFKVVYDIHEHYPSVILQKHWIPYPIRKTVASLFDKYETRCVRKLAGISVVSREQLSRLITAHAAVLPNYPDLSLIREQIRTNSNHQSLRFVYLGTLGPGRGIENMIASFLLFLEKGYTAELRIIGHSNSSSILSLVEEAVRNCPSIKFYGRRRYIDALKLAAECDVGLFLPPISKSKEISSPLKLFEYMALGLVALLSDFPTWKAEFEPLDCMIFADPESPKSIVSCMVNLTNDSLFMQQKRDNAMKNSEKYSWEGVAERLVSLYQDIIRR